MAIQTKTMVVKSDTALAETKTTIRDTVTFDTSKLPNGITYKGLKAVLSFADPIQWNKASTYDSLTVVWDDATHASYASKRPVPQNIELTNDFYWFRTADLDAQVELYRQEVQNMNDRVTANTQAIARQDGKITALENYDNELNTLKGTNYNPLMKSLNKVASFPSTITSVQGSCLDNKKNLYIGSAPNLITKFNPPQYNGETLTEIAHVNITKSGQDHVNSLCYYDGNILFAGSGDGKNIDIGVIDAETMTEKDPIQYQTDPARIPSLTTIAVVDLNQTFTEGGHLKRVVKLCGLSYQETEMWQLAAHYDTVDKTFKFIGVASVMPLMQGPAYTQDMAIDGYNAYVVCSRLGNRRVSAPKLETSYLMSFNINKYEGCATLPLPYNDNIYNEFESIYIDGFNLYLVSGYGIWEPIPYNFRPVENINTWCNSPIFTVVPLDFTDTVSKTEHNNICELKNLPSDFYRAWANGGKVTFDVKLKFTYDIFVSCSAVLLPGSDYANAVCMFNFTNVDYLLNMTFRMNTSNNYYVTGLRIFDLTAKTPYNSFNALATAHSDMTLEKFLVAVRSESKSA